METGSQNLSADEAVFRFEQRRAEAEAKKSREIAVAQAREQNEAERVSNDERKRTMLLQHKNEEEEQVAAQAKLRGVAIAQKGREREVAVEAERVERARQLEAIGREREVSLVAIARDKDVEVQKKEIADVVRARVAVDKTVAKHRARERAVTAEAELEASDKQARAKARLAEGTMAEAAAAGLAEARVKEADADATEKQGRARAAVTRETLLAEAAGEEQKGISLARAYVEAVVGAGAAQAAGGGGEAGDALEATALLVTERRVERDPSAAETRAAVTGLLGQHPRVVGRALELDVGELLARVRVFRDERLPRYRAYRRARAEATERARRRLRPAEFAPQVLSSFVRNQLVNEVYLPLVGANLAKPMGAAGDQKRTDRMGLLLLVSPPGYGKTTLMEYVASRLGLAFVKIDGPSLGHETTSLDPAEARGATARREVEKINLAFAMGQNVMLYLDDIQHTSPELLQKFVSLGDAQRRVEGVWGGQTRTYDLKGKRFCVVMAGNPLHREPPRPTRSRGSYATSPGCRRPLPASTALTSTRPRKPTPSARSRPSSCRAATAT